ncbi:MAG: SH3 domain-containing protein [Roseiflexaceae bacterium]|nr:SH3 domain-containing protein [Roseiflexaceae bacterium]
MKRFSNEVLGFVISCAGAFGFIAGMLPDLTFGGLGLMFLAGTLLGSLLVIVIERKPSGVLRVCCAAGLSMGMAYFFGSLPTNPLAQQWAGQQMQELVRSVGESASVAVVTPAASSTAVPAALAAEPIVALLAATPVIQVLEPNPAVETYTAVVSNGGNVRERPVDGAVLDQINAGEQVQLLKKTQQSSWYFILNQRGVIGWVSATLLDVASETDSRVPIAPE